jgi:hypothetical protein
LATIDRYNQSRRRFSTGAKSMSQVAITSTTTAMPTTRTSHSASPLLKNAQPIVTAIVNSAALARSNWRTGCPATPSAAR